MYSPSLFVGIPVALFLVACANPSAALVVGNKPHGSTKNKTMTAHSNFKPDSRRTRTKHVIAQAQRRAVDADGYLDDLTLDYGKILAASNAFSSSAQNVRSNSDDSSRRDAATQLASFQQTLPPLHLLFANLGADKGLANYDKSDQYETLLKDIVNVNKYALDDTSRLISADPLLGPLLGPIVYEIKCILDELLDYTENTTDAVLNSLALPLKDLISSATGTVCRSIVPPVAGLCVAL